MRFMKEDTEKIVDYVTRLSVTAVNLSKIGWLEAENLDELGEDYVPFDEEEISILFQAVGILDSGVGWLIRHAGTDIQAGILPPLKEDNAKQA